MKVLVLGTRALGYRGIEAISRSDHEVVCAATWEYDITEGYGPDEFRDLCEARGIPLWVTDKANAPEFLDWVTDAGADVGLSLYWKRLIGGDLIRALPKGFLNVHASQLPKYRGFANHTWAIVRGESHCGVTLHYMDPDVADSGDIAIQRLVPITDSTTIASLFEDINAVGVEIVLEFLDALDRGDDPRVSMKLEDGFWSYPRLPRDGEIDWSLDARSIDRLVRAVTRPYPGAFTYMDGQKLLVWRSRVLDPHPRFVGVPGHVVGYDSATRGAVVTTGDGLLVVEEAQFDGEPEPFAPKERWRSVQLRFGPCLTDELVSIRARLDALERIAHSD